MLNLIELLIFAVTQTFFAWHLFTCPAMHSPTIAFVFVFIAGGFWLIAALNFVYSLLKRGDEQ